MKNLRLPAACVAVLCLSAARCGSPSEPPPASFDDGNDTSEEPGTDGTLPDGSAEDPHGDGGSPPSPPPPMADAGTDEPPDPPDVPEGYHPENYGVCDLPVLYRNELYDTDPAAKLFEDKLGGPDGVIAALELMPRMACAILYPTPEAAAAAVHPSARIVMNLSPNRWPFESPGYTDENGKNWYDYPAGDMGELFFDEAGDPVKNTLGTVQHEVTHLNTPPGNKHPKWIEETLCDYVRLKAGFVEERAIEEAKERHYCNGYNTGAAFFDWLEREWPGFIHALTSHITEHRDDDWLGGYPQDASNSDAVFAAVTGAPLAELWHDYRETLGAIDPPLDCDEASWRNY